MRKMFNLHLIIKKLLALVTQDTQVLTKIKHWYLCPKKKAMMQKSQKCIQINSSPQPGNSRYGNQQNIRDLSDGKIAITAKVFLVIIWAETYDMTKSSSFTYILEMQINISRLYKSQNHRGMIILNHYKCVLRKLN